jgi:hypothetical protein
MMLVAFRSRLTSAAGDDYARMAAEMEAHAKTSHRVPSEWCCCRMIWWSRTNGSGSG